MQHQHAAISTNNLPRAPRRVFRAKHAHNPGHLGRTRRPTTTLLRISHHLVRIKARPRLHQRRVHDPALDTGQEVGAVALVHRPLDRAGVDGVHRRAVRQLPRPGARHGFYRGLAAAVDGLRDESRAGADRRKIDNPPRPIGGQVRLHGLGDQQRPQHIHSVSLFELGYLDVFQERILRYAGVVDEDVDL